MSFKLLSGLTRFSLGLKMPLASFCTTVTGKLCRLEVRHDREQQRFTVTDSGEGEDAVLSYRFTADSEVELVSTFVPESSRGKGLAALLSKAALDFVVDEQLTARVSCWYIHKYLQENPLKKYTELIRS
ncbi:protein NATD1-like [Eucyclogobius newberryi]|uniref:protein NATD1-like n=1 Tax=Eucyclogobius newberryi TaxID=166745 RepID=UPI003B5B45CF